jgi:hypothetical protein
VVHVGDIHAGMTLHDGMRATPEQLVVQEPAPLLFGELGEIRDHGLRIPVERRLGKLS